MSWTASTTTSVVGYNIYRAPSSTGPYTLLTTTPVNAVTYTDAGVPVNTTIPYSYKVTAVGPACTPTTTTPCGESVPVFITLLVPPRPVAITVLSVTIG